MKKPLVIIGSGHAGYTLARAFRQHDSTTPVVVLTEDGGEHYPKPQLSHGFGHQASAERLTLNNATGMAAELKIMVRPRTRVSAIDFVAQKVTAGEVQIPYSDLVLAVGAEPFVPPVGGDAAQDILTLNNLEQYRRYLDRLNRSEHVLVIGGGLIGTEIAHDIAQHKRVTLVDIGSRLLERLVPEVVSQRLHDVMDQVTLRFGTGVERVERAEQGYRVTLSDGDTLAVDAVVCAAGLKPRLELAAGLETGRGIVVDAYLRTSQPHVYALGDCAEIEGQILPYLQPITLSANALASTLAGTPTPVRFGPLPVAVKTPRYPIQLAGVTQGNALDWQISEGDDGLTALAHRDSQLVGYVTTGSRNGFSLLPSLAR
ncbi:nitric oxide reductase FlRd-NAD(+) reductase [Pseudogulbenkiania sp. NH8B]|uniref:FAD-dependent oxidoreductase n=1 Tax=Pseudogulbenkiania sp. (strain NH8B) TaxID=748280 RepID=UPI0002279E26|nr:FAD-dependent oxidoreductase [Pseudogulbenkiania sp. NH8B]BAK77757.1 nitric oxide reductase FlRd-NAD(+) reductase [Pseudogulbenkiania sp. NH8B]